MDAPTRRTSAARFSALALCALATLAACSGPTSTDAGRDVLPSTDVLADSLDAARDTSTDVTQDDALDATHDAPLDALPDAPSDVLTDTPVDVAPDVPPVDACVGRVCSGACIDPQTDVNHCGMCGMACGRGYRCVAGACACESGAGTPDQANRGGGGQAALRSMATVGQSWVAGRTGTLTGIELGLAICLNTSVTGSLDVTVTGADGATLGTGTIPFSTIHAACAMGPIEVGEGAPTLGHFDLSASCIQVTAGATYTATFSVTAPPGVCDRSTNRCATGDTTSLCFNDLDCAALFNARFNSDVYPSGMLFSNGTPLADSDLNFRTFVR